MAIIKRERYVQAIILGCGMTGLASAVALQRKGISDIAMLDSYQNLGGNHIDVNIGNYTFDIGSFFFQDDSPFLELFPELLPHYLPGDYSIGKLTARRSIAKYPLDIREDVLSGNIMHKAHIILSLIAGRLRSDPGRNASDYVSYWIGRYFGSYSGLLPYMKRFYGAAPEEIEGIFAQKRMMFIAENARLASMFKRFAKQPTGSKNRQIVRPREGFAALYAIAGERLLQSGAEIYLDQKFVRIEPRDKDGLVTVETETEVFRSPLLISTIPLTLAMELCGLERPKNLQSADLTTLFYSYDGERSFEQNVLYNFSNDGVWKRMTIHSDFYGKVGGRVYFSVENISRGGSIDAEQYDADFRQHMAVNSLLQGDLRLEGYRVTPHAYPVYLDGATQSAKEATGQLEKLGVLSYGRQGGFDYQPTARVSALTAQDSLNRASISVNVSHL